MTPQTRAVLEQTLRFSIDTIAFSRSLPNDPAGWTIAKQVIRSATSVGANFREAQYARSRQEFVSKIHIALQEAAESLYWLKVVEGCELGNGPQVTNLANEADQIVRILVSICNSTKKKT